MWLSLVFALFLPWQAAPAETCSLMGTVVDSVTGEPLGKVQLDLEPAGRRSAPAASTATDAQGHFAMTGLEPGAYHLNGKRRGYLEMAYGARRPNGDGTVVQLDKGQDPLSLTFKLIPGAVIAGTIRDSDGEPLEDAEVSLYKITYRFGRPRADGYASADTDDRGEYRFHGLNPDKYYVSAISEDARMRYPVREDHSANPGNTISVQTYYPGVTDASSAAPVQVSAGGSAVGIDITVRKTRSFRVSGRVTNAPATGSIQLTLADPGDLGESVTRTTTRNAAGDFEFRAVPPGAYLLIGGTSSLFAQTRVEVGAADAENLRVTLAPGADVKLRVTAEGQGNPDLSQFDYFLTANGRSGYASMWGDPDRLTARNVLPGRYTLRLSGGLLRTYYVKSARAGDADVLADGLAVEGSGAIVVDILLAADGAAVQGAVSDKDQQPVAGATVLLAPNNRSRADLFKSTTTDQNGRYALTTLAPGDYKLFAWDDVEPDAWSDPDFLAVYEKSSEKISLAPQEQASRNLRVAAPPDTP
jgi:protocatechuate 3,4-dioxygenase beta subunit